MKLVVLLFSYILVSWSFGQQLNVLFIGNSYTHGHNMPKIFESLANSKDKDVFADSIAVSGSTLKGHTERPRTFEKIKSKKWDVVFIQGFSRELAQDSTTIANETIPYAKMIVDSVKANNPCVELFVYLTWGYKDGYVVEPYNDTYLKMQENIRKGYYQLSDALKIPISPVGMVWKDYRANYPSDNLYQTDNQHPNPNGSYLAACTFYATIFKETPVGATCPKSVLPENATNIQKTAEKIVLNNLSLYRLDKEQHPVVYPEPILDFENHVNWLSVTIDNQTIYGTGSYIWDFGDGKTSKKNEPVYYYAKSGTYTITLTAKKGCHYYKMKKKVTVSNKLKNAEKPQKSSASKKKK